MCWEWVCYDECNLLRVCFPERRIGGVGFYLKTRQTLQSAKAHNDIDHDIILSVSTLD